MCGIFAYNGENNSIPKLIEGLRNLEYRGYDSAGVLGVNSDGNIFLEKAVGKVSVLANEVDKNDDKSSYTSGIAHTRWATHGKVTKANTHPHYSQNERFYVVHNGIIENYDGIKTLLKKEYNFYSETDSEVIAKLLEHCYDGDLKSTIEKVCEKLVGAYAIAIIDKQNPTELIGTKLGSPLIIGNGDDGVYISSDINALSGLAHEFTPLEDNEMVVIKDGKYNIFSSGEKIERTAEKMTKKEEKSGKGDFDTFTEKEIHDIPETLKNVFNGRINFETKTITNETLNELNEHDIERIEIIASGSSYFAGFTGTYWFKQLAGIQAEVRISNEFLYETFLPDKKTLYIFMSQSGETADVRECLKMVKSKGCLTFGIVNVVGSTIARMCDMGLHSHSGTEIGVASTKNIIGQLGVLILMALSMGLKRDLQYSVAKEIITEIGKLPEITKKQLENKKDLKKLAKKYSKYKNMFFLGRNLLYATASECSLKLKELAYIHSECYSSGELKHGPLALVSKDFPCIVLNPCGLLREKTNSNIKEIKARNGRVLGVTDSINIDPELYDDIIKIPQVNTLLSPFVPLIPMWLFSVYIATELGRDVDKPQNLAKSVTVE